MIENNPYLKEYTQIKDYDCDDYLYLRVINKAKESKSLIIPNVPHPSQKQLNQLYKNYRLSREFEHNNILTYIEINDDLEFPIAITEDFSGIPLSYYIQENTINITEICDFILQVIEGLLNLHNNNFIHLRINPNTILINPKTKEVKLSCFDDTIHINEVKKRVIGKNISLNLVQFMPPESTGKTNYLEDERSDLYSVGLVLYFLLTKSTPFNDKSLPKLIYLILAQDPSPPKILDQNVPQYMSDIAIKLIRKSPNERYQSLLSLKNDITFIKLNLSKEEPVFNFEFIPAQNDLLNIFYDSNNQVGREKELLELQNLYKSASNGEKVIALIEGEAGIGKSLLINDFTQQVNKGQYAVIKLDQYKHEIQFNLLLNGFKKILIDLLQKEENIYNRWKLRFQNKLGSTASILEPYLPEINHFIITNGDLPKLEGQEALNRFKIVMHQFVEVLSSETSPFMLVIEDIHWINEEMIEFLYALIENIDLKYFMLILNYRPENITKGEYRENFLNKVKQKTSNYFQLHPLDHENIKNLLINIIDNQDPKKDDLIKLIHNKTLGNPLNVKKFLKSLEIMNLITFEDETLNWVWHTEVLKSVLDYGDYNDLISHSLGNNSELLIKLLKFASCIGNYIELSILKGLTNEFIDDLNFFIHQAKNIGILSKQSNINQSEQVYKFNHDSIREYFYNNIETDLKNRIHLQTGRIITKLGIDNSNEKLLLALDQYNRSLILIDSIDEKVYVSRLNLNAGNLLLRSLAYRSSLKYFTNGISLFPEKESDKNKELLLDLYRYGAEAAYLCFDTDMLDSIAHQIKFVTNNPILQAFTVSLQIRLKFSQLLFDETLELGFQALSDFNVQIDLNKNLNDIFEEYQSLKLRLLDRGLNEINEMPSINDKSIVAQIHLLESLLEVSYTYKPELYPVFVFKILTITLESGNHEFLGNCLANMALLAGGLFNDIEFANELCLIGIKTWKTSRDKFIIYFGSFTWKHHYRSSLLPLNELISSYVETGEFSYSGFASFQYSYVMLQIGYNLKFISDMTFEFRNVFIKTNDSYNLMMNSILYESLLKLQGQKNSFNLLEEQLLVIGNNNLLCHFYNLKLFTLYIHGDLDDIIEVGQKALNYSIAVIGSVEFIAIYYFYSLAILRTQRQSKIQKDELNLLIQELFGKFEVWSQIFPENFEHKFLLMQAENRNNDSEFREVANLYEHAITLAKKHKYNLDEALSYELASRFYFENNFIEISKTYIQKALKIYNQIGAREKINLLEDEFKIRSSIDGFESSDLELYGDKSYTHLDFTSLIKTLLALSSETDYDKLINSMMKIIIEHSGAENSLLLINAENEGSNRDDWLFQAQFDKDSGKIKIYDNDNFIYINDNLLLPELPTSIFNYSVRTGQSLLVQDSLKDERFFDDPYILENQIKTFIALPLKSQDKVKGFLFLGNSKMEGVFKPSQLEFIKVISFQFLISIENSNLYKKLKTRIRTRDEKLNLARQLADVELVKLSKLKDLETSKISSNSQEKSTDQLDQFIDYINYLAKILEPSELEEIGFT